jgi:hypothetical protein
MSVIKNNMMLINTSAVPALIYTNFLLQYHPNTMIILSIIAKYVSTTAVSVGDLIAQNATTIE